MFNEEVWNWERQEYTSAPIRYKAPKTQKRMKAFKKKIKKALKNEPDRIARNPIAPAMNVQKARYASIEPGANAGMKTAYVNDPSYAMVRIISEGL